VLSPADIARTVGYTDAELTATVAESNLGVGCGNPLALADIHPGMTVLDLGCGAGFDAFLAWRKVGPTGRVIGVDMTDGMLARARANAAQIGAVNVDFRNGRIEALPVESGSVDLVISNCVINLSPDKKAVFREIARVLKPGGRFAISDLVLLAPLSDETANDVAAYVGCIAGASLLTDYLRLAVEAGLTDLTVPQVTVGSQLVSAMGASVCCGSGAELSTCLASAKIHGRKPATLD
jgi:SAM-dependent methyltransferase